MAEITHTENKAGRHEHVGEPLVVEQSIHAPVETVWKAITDRDQMQQWYFDLEEFRPEVDFEFHFWGVPSPERRYLHVCKITEIETDKKLTYSWRYKGYAGESFVTFLFIPNGDKTLVRLTHAGLESFPADNPDFAKSDFIEGWNHFIGTSLKQFLEG